MPTTAVLLLLAGLSEAVGRLLPLASRRPGGSPRFAVISLATGALVEGAIFSSWPWVASQLAERLVVGDGASVEWTPRLVAPLLLAAILAFPMIGPLLHVALVTGVGISLGQVLNAESDIGWPTALACVAAAGIGLTITVTLVRWVVAWTLIPHGRTEVA